MRRLHKRVVVYVHRQRAAHPGEALRRPPSTYGLMILLPMATYMLGDAAAARFAPRFGTLQLLLAGRTLAFAAALGMALGQLRPL